MRVSVRFLPHFLCANHKTYDNNLKGKRNKISHPDSSAIFTNQKQPTHKKQPQQNRKRKEEEEEENSPFRSTNTVLDLSNKNTLKTAYLAAQRSLSSTKNPVH